MEEKITVIIEKDGTVSIEIDGIVGPSCKTITEALQKRLGAQVLESTEKSEMYMELDNVRQKVTQGL